MPWYFSGVLMLNRAVVDIKLANDPDLIVTIKAEELSARLTWNTLVYLAELSYDEGLEIGERCSAVISFA